MDNNHCIRKIAVEWIFDVKYNPNSNIKNELKYLKLIRDRIKLPKLRIMAALINENLLEAVVDINLIRSFFKLCLTACCFYSLIFSNYSSYICMPGA